jgi:hypothetical protein
MASAPIMPNSGRRTTARPAIASAASAAIRPLGPSSTAAACAELTIFSHGEEGELTIFPLGGASN